MRLLPTARHAEQIQHPVTRHDPAVFDQALGGQHSVEGIAMILRESSGPLGVGDTNQKRVETGLRDPGWKRAADALRPNALPYGDVTRSTHRGVGDSSCLSRQVARAARRGSARVRGTSPEPRITAQRAQAERRGTSRRAGARSAPTLLRAPVGGWVRKESLTSSQPFSPYSRRAGRTRSESGSRAPTEGAKTFSHNHHRPPQAPPSTTKHHQAPPSTKLLPLQIPADP